MATGHHDQREIYLSLENYDQGIQADYVAKCFVTLSAICSSVMVF